MSTKPYMTTDALLQSIKRKVMAPYSQQTFMYNDIVAIVNEELQLNAVPSVKELHEEYFVYDVATPIVSGISRYPIPDRAIGMALRDLCYADLQGNYNPMTRLAPENKSFFQENSQVNGSHTQYYIRGNEIVLSQSVNAGATGNMIFSIFLRPNQLVRDDRAAIIQAFQKAVVVTSVGSMQVGDTVSLTIGVQSQNPSTYVFTAVASSPGMNQFVIGVNETLTASNIATAITNAGIDGVTATSLTNICTISYDDISSTFAETSNGLMIDNDNLYIQFDNLAATYTDIDTNQTTPLYTVNGKVDFLQTNPGHRTYTYDVKLRQMLPNNVGKFKLNDLNTYLSNSNGGAMSVSPIKVGDYICLANECIIPQIPPELHPALAERAAARILSSMGDKDGYAISQAKIQEMDKQQAALIGSRVDGTVRKVFNRNSLLRLGKRTSRRI
jgi:hypothetical protein